MFEAVEGMLAEHAALEQQLGAPETHADARLAKQLNQRYAALSSIIGAYRDLQRLDEDLEAARELALEDPGFAEEAERARRTAADDERRLKAAEEEARRLAEQRAAEEARRAGDEATRRRLVSPGEGVERGEDLPPVGGGVPQLNFDSLPGVN